MKKDTALTFALVIMIAGWLVYWNAVDNPFVYDDLVYIEQNAAFDDPSNLKLLFSDQYFHFSGERSYRPVSTALIFLDVMINGRHPVVFKISSIAIHSMNGALVMLIVLALGARPLLALFSGLLFVVHPLQTEAVNGSSFIEDPLSALFFFAAMLFYVNSRKLSSPARYALSIVFAFLAFFSKESAAMLPFCLILYELIFRRDNKGFKSALPALAGHFAVFAVFVYIRFVLFSNTNPSAAAGLPMGDIVSTAAVMSVAFLKYLRLFFFPLNLTIEQCVGTEYSLVSGWFVLSVVIHSCLFILAVAALRVNKILSFGVFFYLMNLAPISNIIPFGAIMAERYMYLPVFGLCLFLAALFNENDDKEKKFGAVNMRLFNVAFLIFVSILFARLTMARNVEWSSARMLWEKAMDACPYSSRARTNYARRLIEEGDYVDAIDRLKEAVYLDPKHYEALNALGSACFHERDYKCAIQAYKKSLSLKPTNDVMYNLAILYMGINEPGPAMTLLKEILRTQPDWPSAHYLLGNVYLRRGQHEQAEKEYLWVINADPNYLEAKGNLGVLYRETGRYREALTLFLEILRADPSNEFARSNIEIVKSKIK